MLEQQYELVSIEHRVIMIALLVFETAAQSRYCFQRFFGGGSELLADI